MADGGQQAVSGAADSPGGRAVPEEQERRDIGLFLKVRDTFLFRQHALCVNTFGAAEHRDSLYKAVRISRKDWDARTEEPQGQETLLLGR